LDLLLFHVCKLIVFFDVMYCFSVNVVLMYIFACSVFHCNFVPIFQCSVVVVFFFVVYSILLGLVFSKGWNKKIFTDTLSGKLATCLGTIFLDSLT